MVVSTPEPRRNRVLRFDLYKKWKNVDMVNFLDSVEMLYNGLLISRSNRSRNVFYDEINRKREYIELDKLSPRQKLIFDNYIIYYSLNFNLAIAVQDRLTIDSIKMSSPQSLTLQGEPEIIHSLSGALEYLERNLTELKYEECIEGLRKFYSLEENELKFLCRKAMMLKDLREQEKLLTLSQRSPARDI